MLSRGTAHKVRNFLYIHLQKFNLQQQRMTSQHNNQLFSYKLVFWLLLDGVREDWLFPFPSLVCTILILLCYCQAYHIFRTVELLAFPQTYNTSTGQIHFGLLFLILKIQIFIPSRFSGICPIMRAEINLSGTNRTLQTIILRQEQNPEEKL